MNRSKNIEQYWGLVDVVLDSLLATQSMRQYKYMREDLHSEGTIGLIRGLDNYKPMGAQKVTYLSLRIRGAILDYLKKNRRHEKPDVDINYIYETTPDESETYEEGDNALVEKYEPKDPINKAIYHRLIMGGASQMDIANEFGVSRTAIKLRKLRLLKSLKQKMLDNKEIELC